MKNLREGGLEEIASLRKRVGKAYGCYEIGQQTFNELMELVGSIENILGELPKKEDDK